MGHRGFLVILVAAAAAIYSVSQSLQLLSNEPTEFVQNNEKAVEKTFKIKPLFQQQYDAHEAESTMERCTRYGFQYQPGQRKRRIFFGAMVADEEYDLVRMHAAEVYGIYHYVALVESNSTHTATHRTLRFSNGTEGYDIIHSGIFGPHTTVRLDVYLEDAFGAMEMDREEIQREEILKRWKKAGMQEDDVGLMADMDETFTRDFLLAAQTAKLPQAKSLRPKLGL
mmetsp:Transcript_9512/g.15817  ORF Transcript_9512/g.15817 Transcript_9512/m.15817 type:complete len:226 (-) Transcript_9512:100-777(-)